MNSSDRVKVALAALPKATPGPWNVGDPEVVASGCICSDSVGKRKNEEQ